MTMNKPCNMQCGNDPDFECETCHYRNRDYPMPGAARVIRILKAKLNGKDYRPTVLWCDLGDDGSIDRILIDASKPPIGDINHWEHWIPIRAV